MRRAPVSARCAGVPRRGGGATRPTSRQLTRLQRELLDAALRLVRPGGVVGYVTCSPHLAETAAIVAGHEVLDARPYFPAAGPGPTVQLWPHLHGTDAMFCALLSR